MNSVEHKTWAEMSIEERDNAILDSLCEGDGPMSQSGKWQVSRRTIAAHMATDRFIQLAAPVKLEMQKSANLRAEFLKSSVIVNADAASASKVEIENLYTVSRYAMPPSSDDDKKSGYTDEDREAAVNGIKQMVYKLKNGNGE